jgi:lipid A 3-O-deacylase
MTVYLIRDVLRRIIILFGIWIVKYLLTYKSVVISIIFLSSNLMITQSFSGTSGGIYDMSVLLNQPHPFAQVQSSQRLMQTIPINKASAVGYLNPRNSSGLFKIKPTSGTKTTPTIKNQEKLLNNGQPLPSFKISKKQLKPNLIISQNYDPSSNTISEIRIGALWHDQGPFSHRKEKGYDGNLEILFISPDFLENVWRPRPHVGVSINSAGDTNQAYLGLTWQRHFYQNYFANFSLGAGYHDGYKVTDLLDRKSLGCKLLFRESIDVGYRFENSHSIMAHLDHISNAKLCSTNEGLESVGIRYGYHF